MNSQSLRTFRIVLWALVVVAAVAATALFVLRPPSAAPFGGGAFALVDQRGAPIDQTAFEGHPSLLFFGYTHCPDVCPTTMAEMSNWFAALGGEAGNLKAYFITVDPERDTPAILGEYIAWVSDRITGITGPRAEIDKVLTDWRIVAEKVPSSDGGYTMNHTASVFLLDSKGQFRGTIAYQEDKQTALTKIRRLIAENR